MICLDVKSQKREYMRDVTGTEYYFQNLVHVIRVNQWRCGGNSCLFNVILFKNGVQDSLSPRRFCWQNAMQFE